SALVRPPRSASATLFPYTTLFRSDGSRRCSDVCTDFLMPAAQEGEDKCAKIGVSRAGYIRISDGRGSDDLHCFSILDDDGTGARSEEHTSELQSRENLVCRLLLEK